MTQILTIWTMAPKLMHLAPLRRTFSTAYRKVMPRVMPPIVSQKKASWWDNGNFFIYLGWSGLGLLIFDRYLLYTQSRDSQNIISTIAEETRQKRVDLFEQWKDKPTLFRCIVREEYKMGGSHGLQNIKKNDKIEVLQEGVGPGGYYNLCRTRHKDGTIDSIGWYPISYVQKL